MEQIQVAVKSFGDSKSTLLDEFERLSVEIQLNQAMLRRSLSEPGTSMFHARLGIGVPPLLPQPVKQAKPSSWIGLHRMVKKIFRPVFWKKRVRKAADLHEQEQCYEHKKKDLKSWKRFSKSVRHY